MGEGSDLIGVLLAFFIGSAAAGPLYGAFPVVGILLKKGSKLLNVFIMMGSWSTTKIPLLLSQEKNRKSYFAGQNNGEQDRPAIRNAVGFVLGFTLVFVILGAFAGTIGNLLKEYSTAVNIIAGVIVMLFGLNFMNIIRLPFINTHRQLNSRPIKVGLISSVTFGVIFSISWTPCVGAFLGSALMLAASTGDSIHGILMLFSFSLGLGIPFLASAVLIERLKYEFEIIKRNYRIINLISGGLLVIVGFMMATGMMGYFLSVLTF